MPHHSIILWLEFMALLGIPTPQLAQYAAGCIAKGIANPSRTICLFRRFLVPMVSVLGFGWPPLRVPPEYLVPSLKESGSNWGVLV